MISCYDMPNLDDAIKICTKESKMADEVEVVKRYYKHKWPAIVNLILKEKYPSIKVLSRQTLHI